MVDVVSMDLTDSRMLNVSWKLKQPISPPSGYQLKYECRQFAGGPAYLKDVIRLHSLQKSCLLGPLLDQSQCNFNLLAIYNEASLDPGLKFVFLAVKNQK